MNTLLAWFNSPEWMMVVKTLLHTLWQAGSLALLLWIALRRVATPSSRYRLTLGTLATILGATLLTWALLNQSTPKPIASDYPQETIPAYKPSTTSPTASFREPSVIAYATPIAKPAQETSWSGWLALTWLLGAALMLTRAGIQVAGAERLRRSCKPLDDSRITQLLAEAQHALNLTRRIRVAVTDKLTSPAVVGVIVPTLILPLTLLSTLTPEQIRFILLHELAHIRRGDYFANLFQLFIEALLFFNPAVWWISHQVRREREACCDALAIELSGAPVDYARTLLHVAETVLNPPPAAATAFSDNPREPSSLTDRLQRLLVPGYRPALRLTWRAMLAAIVVGGTLLFLSAVGARNVVGAVSTNSIGKVTGPATNVVASASGKSDLWTNSFTMPKWEKGSSSWERRTNGQEIVWFSQGTKYEILERLERIKFDRVFFQNRKLTEVLAELDKGLLATDPKNRGFHLMLPPDWEPPAKREGIESVIINMPSELRDTTMRRVLEEIVSSASKPIQYKLGAATAYFHMKWDEPPNLSFNRFNVNRRTFLPFIGFHDTGSEHEFQRSNITNVNARFGDAIRERFLKAGVDLRPPNHVFYTPEPDLLYVYAPKAELDKVEALLKSIGQKSDGNTNSAGKRGGLLDFKFFQYSDDSGDPKTKSFLYDKTDADRINPSEYENYSMLIHNVGTQDQLAKQWFYYRVASPRLEELTSSSEEQSVAELLASSQKVSKKISRFGSGNEVNDSFSAVNSQPFPQVIALRHPTNTATIQNLATRTFHTDANMMAQALGIIPKVIGSAGLQTNQLVLPQSSTAATNAAQIKYAVSNTFKAIGVDLNPAQGKTFFYNDREGTILVRATDKELDLIEAYIAKNATPPPQVNIKIRWVEIPQKLMTPAWLNAASNAFFLPLVDPETRYNILTEQEMADVRHRIERRDGIELLSEGQVTTLSERQAQISVNEVKTVATGINPKALTKPGVISTNEDASAYIDTELTPLGPVFDVLPTVSADEDTISLQMTVTLTEFLGYDKAKKDIPIYVNGKKTKTTLPLPKYRVRQTTNDTIVPDGRTLILGNFPMTEIAKQPNGEMRTTDVTSTQTNLLIVLVTPTIIDPAGNRASSKK